MSKHFSSEKRIKLANTALEPDPHVEQLFFNLKEHKDSKISMDNVVPPRAL